MGTESTVLSGEAITGRGNSLNPLVVLEDASGFIEFATEVFAARGVDEVRTATPDGSLIHAEVRVGDALLLLADVQPGWSPRPGLFQLWVSDVDAILQSAVRHGSTVVTPPTPFYGELTLARFADRWGNLWWLYQPSPGQPDPKPVWEGGSDTVFRTLDEYLRTT